jgi:hypothetical protein
VCRPEADWRFPAQPSRSMAPVHETGTGRKLPVCFAARLLEKRTRSHRGSSERSMVATLGDCLATDHARILVEQRLRARRRSDFSTVSPGRSVSNEHGLSRVVAPDPFKFGLGGQVRAGGQNRALRRAAAPRGDQGRARRSARRAVRRRERGDPTASAAAPITATRSGTPTASVRATTGPASRVA